MLERVSGRPERRDIESLGDRSELISIDEVRRFFERYLLTIGAATLACTLIAAFYALSATPIFSAYAQMLIETTTPTEPTMRASESSVSLDTPQVESQLALLRSERIAEKVARRFNLDVDEKNVAETAPLAGVVDWFWGFVPSSPFSSEDTTPISEEELEYLRLRRAINVIQSNMDVGRVGISYVLAIGYNSPDPTHAADMANAIAEAYVEDRLETRAQAAQQGSKWLEERIDDLRRQMNSAALDVQEFRARRDYRIIGRDKPGKPQAEGEEPAPDERGAPQTLEELQSRADTYRKIYESFLQAYTESVQRQSYPVTNARVITRASKPKTKSSPKRTLILLAGTVIGGLLGLGLALLRHSLDYRVNSPQQVREELGIDCLGQVARQDKHTSQPLHLRVQRKFFELIGREGLDPGSYRLSEVHDLPISRFSRGVKSVRTAINVATKSQPLQVLGVTSALPREGKTTFVGNLATLYGQSEQRTLLIDADVHNPALTRLIAPDASAGLVEVLSRQAKLDDCILASDGVRPDFLPLFLDDDRTDVGALLAGGSLSKLFARLREKYDLIVVDLPPMKPTTETLAVSSVLDGVVIVAEWEVTPMPVLADAVYQLRRANTTVAGLVLTKVDRMHEEVYGARIRGREYTG